VNIAAGRRKSSAIISCQHGADAASPFQASSGAIPGGSATNAARHDSAGGKSPRLEMVQVLGRVVAKPDDTLRGLFMRLERYIQVRQPCCVIRRADDQFDA
jgi:hypothetical protein